MSTLLEKLNKEELLNSAVLELHSIMDLVAYWEDNDIKMPDNENMHQTMANLGPNRYEIGMVVSTNPIKKINVWARVWYAILFLLEGRKVPDIINQSIAKDKGETIEYYEYLRDNGLEIPEVIQQSYLNYKTVKESVIVNEKLDKDELVGVIANNHDASWELVDMCIKNQFVIPEIVLNNYFKDHPIFSEKEIPSIGLHILINKWHMYAHNLLRKNIDIPEIVLKAVSKQMGLASDLIAKFIKAKKDVPEILIKSISSSPKDSYWLARYLIERNKKVPEILNQSIAKEPMLLQTYKQFLREIEVEKKVKEAYASKEEVKESAIVNEKLDKEELLQAAADDPFESFALAKKYVQKYKEPPEELVRGLTQRKKEEWTGANYNHSVAYAMLAIDHDVRVPDYVLESILESEYDAYDYLVKMIKDKRIIPDNFLNSYFEKHYSPPEALEQKPIFGQDYGYSKDVEIWYNYTEILLNKNVEIPENIINAVSKSIYYSERLIDHLLYKKRDVPEILVKAVSLSPQYSYYSATHFIEYGKEVPEILNQVIAKDPTYQYMYNEFLSERKEKKKINESVVINEKLNKDELKQAIFKNPNTTFDYVKKRFLNRNEFPPEEFVNAIAESSHASKKYIDYVINAMGLHNFKPPKILIQRIIQNGDMSLNLLKARHGIENNDFNSDFPYLESISDQDLLKSITKESHLSFGAYQIYKKKGIKIPSNLWQSILSYPTASLYVARDLLENNEPIPEAIIKGVVSKVENAFVFAFDLLRKNMDFPETLLKTLAENSDMARMEANFDSLIITYAESGKEIPEILINGAANKKWRDTDLSNLCLKFATKGLKIPERILDIFIEKTPQYGVVKHLGRVSYDIVSKYIEHAPWTLIYKGTEKAFEIIPSKLYQYIITPDIAGVSQTKNLIKGFLSNFNKVPEDFKQTIINNYKEYGHEIPKDIADDAGIKQSETVNEKLDKEELLDAVIKDKYQVNQMVFNFAANDKKIPEKLVEYISQNWNPSYMYQIAIDIIRYSNYDVPEMILRGIAKSNSLSNEMALLYKNHYLEIPDVIMNALTPKQKEFYNAVWWSEQKPITEKLDKSELLDAVGSNLDKNDILDFALGMVHANAKVPDNIFKIIAERPSWAVDHIIEIFGKDGFKEFKENREDVSILLNNISNDPYASAILSKKFIASNIKVPDILLNGILKSKVTSENIFELYDRKKIKIPDILKKEYEAYIQQQRTHARNVAKKMLKETITEKLDKSELLKVISKDAEGSSIVFQHLWNDSNKRKNIPKEVLRGVSKDPIASYAYARSLSWKDVPLIIVKGIAKDSATSLRYAQDLVHRRIKIPNLIARSIYNNNLFAKRFDYFLFDIKQDKNVRPDKNDKEYFDNLFDGVINEKLDKSELLGVIQKDYDGFIQIMDYFFRKKKEYPPEEFLKMAVETDEASRIFAEYCLEMKKDIPDEVIEKVAENPRSAYTIAALMILEERKVPEILIKSINSDPLSKKHFEQFAKNQKYPIHIPTLYYAKI